MLLKFRDDKIVGQPNGPFGATEFLVGNEYAKAGGYFHYPRDDNGDEYLPAGLNLIYQRDRYWYPYTLEGVPRYPLDEKGRQLYLKLEGKWLFGLQNGKEMYAKDENGNEYYPEDNTAAKLIHGEIYYATAKDGSTVFPKDKDGNEYYLPTLGDDFNHVLNHPPSRYARCKLGFEFYPKRHDTGGEYMIGNEYAVGAKGEPYYPKDSNYNEYYREWDNIKPILLKRFAVTNDGKILVPNQAKAEVEPHPLDSPKIERKHELGILLREDANIPSRVITSVTDPKVPFNTPRKQYSYRLLSSNKIVHVYPTLYPVSPTVMNISVHKPSMSQTTWCCWICLVVLVMMNILCVGWYFFYRKNMPSFPGPTSPLTTAV